MRRVLIILVLAAFGSLSAHAQNGNDNKFGNALVSDGDGDYVTIPDHPLLNFHTRQDFTISAWFRSGASSQGRILLKAGVTNGSPQGYGIMFDYGRIRAFLWSPVFPYGAIELDAPHISYPPPPHHAFFNDNTWHHVALVRDGADLILYVDGQKAQSGSATDTTLVNDSPLRFGADTAEPARFSLDGQIDEVRMWKVARSIKQIRATLYDTLSADYYSEPDSGLIAYYRFDHTEDLGVGGDGADDVRDLSIHANHGDLVGDAYVDNVDVAEPYERPRLTLQFRSMDEHIDELFKVRIFDIGLSREVARHTIEKLTQADFDVWLNALLVGHAYRIDFFADHNYNLEYDPPPGDHAWSVVLNPAVGNDTVLFVHDNNHQHIGWSEYPLLDSYVARWVGRAAGESSGADIEFMVNQDFVGGTVEGWCDVSQLVDLADSVRLYFSGTIADGTEFALQQDSLITSGKRMSGLMRMAIGAATDFDASINIDGALVSGDFAIEVMGVPIEGSIEGTLGRQQSIVSFESDYPGLTGVAMVEEDSILAATIASVGDPAGIHEGFRLAQNYPNPCDESTTFAYTLPQEAGVLIRAVDVLGREVVVVDEGRRPPGEHVVSLRVAELATGPYFYTVAATLATGERVERTRVFVVVR